MAATITDLANGANTGITSGATVTASVGDWLVCICAASNDGSGGASPFSANASDNGGLNTFTRRLDVTYDPGAAGAGASLAVWTAPITSALTNDTVNITLTASITEGAIQVYRVRPGAGETVSFISADTTGSTGNASTYSAATVSVTNGDIIFGCAAIETDDAITGDTDTTNGSWSSVITRLHDNGADASTMSCVSQHKTVNATGNQSWAATSSTARDSARSYIILRSEVTGPTATLSKTLDTLTPSANATVDLGATLSKTLGTLASSANAAVDVSATLAKTLGQIAPGATAEVTSPGDSSLSRTLGALALSANASADVDAAFAKALGTLTGSGNATVDVDATLAKTLGTLTVSASADVVASGLTATLGATLGALTASGAVSTDVAATLAKTLANATSTAAATVDISASVSKTLGTAALAAAAGVNVEAQLSKTLASLGLSANATIGVIAASQLARSQPIQSFGRLNARM